MRLFFKNLFYSKNNQSNPFHLYMRLIINIYLLPPTLAFCCLTFLLPIDCLAGAAFLPAALAVFFLAACSFFLALAFSIAASFWAFLISGFWAFLAWISAQDWEPSYLWLTFTTLLFLLFSRRFQSWYLSCSSSCKGWSRWLSLGFSCFCKAVRICRWLSGLSYHQLWCRFSHGRGRFWGRRIGRFRFSFF